MENPAELTKPPFDKPISFLKLFDAKTRKELFRLREDAVVDPRPHVPEYVVFYIDAKTLLPRRIEYRKRAPDPAQKFDRPLVTLDLRNLVLNESLPAELFAFSAPEGVKEEDVTEQTIQAIQQSAETPDSTPDPATETPATETPATETPATETPATETPK